MGFFDNFFNKDKLSISNFKGSMELPNENVTILAVVKNESVLYFNNYTDKIYKADKDGDLKLQGRVVNFIYNEDTNQNKIEVFVAFDDDASYMLFTMKLGTQQRFNHLSPAIALFIQDKVDKTIFSPTSGYAPQYHFTYKSYRKDNIILLFNFGHTHAYLLTNNSYEQGRADPLKEKYWGKKFP